MATVGISLGLGGPARLRARAGCAVVENIPIADSKRGLLLWEEGKVLSVYLFPRDDVRTDLLPPSENPLPEAHHAVVGGFSNVQGGDSGSEQGPHGSE